MTDGTTSLLRCGICPQLGRPVCIRCEAADEILRLRARAVEERQRVRHEVADEIERLQAENEALRAENESWRSLDQIRLGLLRQSAAEVQRLQALIDAYVTADAKKEAHWDEHGFVNASHLLAVREAQHAVITTATKEDDRE